MRQSRLVSVFLVALVAVALATPSLPRAEAADSGFVLATLDALRENYVDTLPEVPLLNAALASLQQKTGVAAFSGVIQSGVGDAQAAAQFAQRFDEIFSRVKNRYSQTDLAYLAAAGMLESLNDSHTGFISPDPYQEEKRKENGQAAFSGIGILLLARDGSLYIREVFPGSPADVAGAHVFDRVLAIDGHPTTGKDTGDVSQMIRGPAGTAVVVRVERPSIDDPIDLTIRRAPIRIPGVTSRMTDGEVGYLKIYEFVPGVGNEVREAVFSLRRSGMKALILDLRGNPGGLVDELRDVSAAFLPQSSPILQMTKRNGKTVMLETTDPPILPPSVPVVVLVDEGTGSAAELLASALQEQSRAVIEGVKTAGAVEIAITVDLPEGAGMSVTVARLLSGKGVRLEGHGVIPDDPETLTTDAMNLGHDSQFDKALDTVRHKLGVRVIPSLVPAGSAGF